MMFCSHHQLVVLQQNARYCTEWLVELVPNDCTAFWREDSRLLLASVYRIAKINRHHFTFTTELYDFLAHINYIKQQMRWY